MNVGVNFLKIYKRRVLFICFIIAIALGGYLYFSFKNAQLAQAQSCGATFLCPGYQGVSMWDGAVNLSARDGNNTPGGDDGNPEMISAGETIRVDLEFTVNAAYGGQVLAWVNADIGNDCGRPTGPVPPACGQNGGFSNFTPNSADWTLINPSRSNTNGPSNGYNFSEPPIKNNNCPSFYVSGSSNYAPSGNPGGYLPGGTYPYFAGDPEPSGGINAYISTCGYLGSSVMWHGNMTDVGRTYRLGFNYTVNPATLNENNICFRANLSVGSGSALAIVTNLYARSGQRICFQVQKTTIQGLVTSSDQAATGKPLGGVTIGYSRTCNPATHYDTKVTGGNGLYAFDTTKGQQFCIYPSVPINVGGTVYNSVNPASRFGTCNTGFCDGYDFVYTPASVAPNISKITNLGAAPLRPGDTIDYTVVINNPYDSNIQNVDIRDYIPLNLISAYGASQPQLLEFQLYDYASPFRPSGWSVASPGPYSGTTCPFSNFFPIPHSYGDGYPALTANIRCGYSTLGGGSPPHMYMTLERLPAYSNLHIRIRGTVKPPAEVGIYPADYRYCNGAGNYNISGYHPECIDTGAGGLQGVTNFAFTRAEGVVSPNLSNIVYNPIPGSLTAVKDVSGIPDLDGDGFPEYVPNDPEYGQGDFRISVTADDLRGPIEYQAMDQDNGVNNFNAAAPLPAPINPATPNSCFPLYSVCSDRVIWNSKFWPFTASVSESFGFNAVFKDTGQAPGSTFTNKGKVCWTKYWEVGHGVECAYPTMGLERATKTNPYFGVQKGGVNAGGGIKTASGNVCTTSEHGAIRANAGSYGQYVVSAKGSVPANSSRLGLTALGGEQCRPNIPNAVQRYYERGNSYRRDILNGTINTSTSVGGAPINDAGYPSGGPAKVIRTAPGDVNISGLLVSRRWTLHVRGDLYITGNITSNGLADIISRQPSLGILVDGDVYIAPNVTQIDALIFSGSRSLTGIVDGGSINTCSSGPNLTLGSPGGPSAAACKPILRVNGVLMGKRIQFARTNDNTGPNTEAEIVGLIGRAYILPPPGFTSLFSDGGGTNTQDKRPRF